jgi:hypothetical protein
MVGARGGACAVRALMPPSLAQIQERVGPAPKPEGIKAFKIVYLYEPVQELSAASAACMTCRSGTPHNRALLQPPYSSSRFTSTGGAGLCSTVSRAIRTAHGSGRTAGSNGGDESPWMNRPRWLHSGNAGSARQPSDRAALASCLSAVIKRAPCLSARAR